jgi:hypothetical protein
MNPESKSRPNPEEQAFTIIERSLMLRFTGERMTWGFPWSHLSHFVLKANPSCRNPKKQPPQELTFYFYGAEVTLFGWHLDSMLPHISAQNISRIWMAKNRPKKQTAGVAWIAETFVLPLTNPVPAAAASEANQEQR